MPLQHVDKNFDLGIIGEEIKAQKVVKKGDKEKMTEIKLGKVLAHKYNIGLALVDITKIDKLGKDAVYTLSDYKMMIW